MGCRRETETTHWLWFIERTDRYFKDAKASQFRDSSTKSFEFSSNFYRIVRINEWSLQYPEQINKTKTKLMSFVHLNWTQTANLSRYISNRVIVQIKDSCRRSTSPYFIRYGLSYLKNKSNEKAHTDEIYNKFEGFNINKNTNGFYLFFLTMDIGPVSCSLAVPSICRYLYSSTTPQGISLLLADQRSQRASILRYTALVNVIFMSRYAAHVLANCSCISQIQSMSMTNETDSQLIS